MRHSWDNPQKPDAYWVRFGRVGMAALMGLSVASIALLSDLLLWGLQSDHMGLRLIESLLEGAVAGLFFWLWRRQVGISQREAEIYARNQKIRGMQIREMLQLISLRSTDVNIRRHVSEIVNLLETSPLWKPEIEKGSGSMKGDADAA